MAPGSTPTVTVDVTTLGEAEAHVSNPRGLQAPWLLEFKRDEHNPCS